MSHDPILDDLKALPREAADAHFTSRVLARLDEPVPRRHTARYLLAAAAIAVVALVSPTVVRQWREEQHQRRALAELVSIRAEHAKLTEEWREIRRLVDDSQPFIYLEGSEQHELVLDPRRLQAGSVEVESRPSDDIMPASYHRKEHIE
jgi:hypothetical protein